jgi:hypothetical protein
LILVRKILFVVFLLQINHVAQIRSYDVITKDELKYISIIKLSDIFQLIPQLDLYSIEGYRFKPKFNKNLTNSVNQIHIFINGFKIYQGASEVFNINHLPIHPEQIDSIIVLNGSVFYKNEYLQGIVLDFYLNKEINNYKFVFTHSSGNEIGDPGPYVFTEHASENVDQVGPNTQAYLGYKTNNLSLTLNYLDRVFPATDSKILSRIPKFVFENHQVRFFGTSLELSTKSFLGEHNSLLSFTKTGKAVTGFVYGADLLFMENVSSDIPIETSSLSLNSHNVLKLNNSSDLKININTGENYFSNSKYSPILEFNNTEKWFISNFTFIKSIQKINLNLGMTYFYNDTKERKSDFQIKHKLLSFHSVINFNSLERLNHSISFELQRIEKPICYQLQLYSQYDFENSSARMNLFSGKKYAMLSYLFIPTATEKFFDFYELPNTHLIDLSYK